MKILFLVRHFGYLRNYESVIADLAGHGHQVHLAADREEALGGRDMVDRWAASQPRITVGWTPDRENDDWFWLAKRLRLALDFLRYQDPRYDDAPHLRLRAEERMPNLVLGLLKLFGYRTRPVRAVMRAVIDRMERAVPRAAVLDDYLRQQAPDLVMVTPLVELGSPQLDHMRSAQALGLRTALCVGSWDHLSSKALIRALPDRVFVWNDIQKDEAVRMHGLPPDHVVVTGAQCFDHWFDRVPSQERAEFLKSLNLDPVQPLIVWVCSSLFRGSPFEADLIEEWLLRLRGDTRSLLRDANVLIRPHPQRMDEWRRADLSAFGRVAIRGGYPTDASSKAAYFDALHHASAVVGLNTTALIEAGIVGRPVLSIVDERYAKNQEGTLHWPYLVKVGGGVLQISRGLDEHFTQLASVMEGAGVSREGFVRAFVRPYGLNEPATPRLVAALEELGTSSPPPRIGTPWFAWLVRPVLYPMVWVRQGRTEWVFFRKRARRSLKRAWMATKRTLRQALKVLVLKRVREDQPQLVMAKPERLRARSQELFTGVEEVEETKEILTRIARSGQPIIVGPWLSETGFELLYWIPFLMWAKHYAKFRDDRLTVVSRGGCSSWYRQLTTNYHDVFDFFTPDEFRERNDHRILEQGGQLKHVDLASFDHDILDRVKHAAGTPNAELLHPSLMYKLFRMFWRLQASVGLVHGFTRHRKIAAPALGDLQAHLPADYVAVKFYGSGCLPDTTANQAFIADYVSHLSARHHVVLLNTGVRFDDHLDFEGFPRDRVHVVDHLMTPRNNLDVQTRIIGAARAFVGTYGGFSYLAPLVGVNTVAFFSDPAAFRVDHLEVAKRVFTELNAASFLPLHIRDLDVLRLTVDHLGSDAAPAAGART
ncbi:MAG: hypothetical protein NTY02_12815 [Acidobacteria bacterium]|nr:hypothetical protein [Acidobacteriota bacterium]